MDDGLWFLVLFFVIIVVAFFVLWIVLALSMRLFSFLVFYWVVSLTVGMLVGLISGVMLPWRVLRGQGRAPFRQLTPQDVVAGKVILGGARGESRNYGWDLAWPTYMPYQAREDSKAVVGEAKAHTGDIWATARQWMLHGGSPTLAGSLKARVLAAVKALAASSPTIAAVALVLPPVAAYLIGLWASIVVWQGIMAVGGMLWVIVQKVVLAGLKAQDVLTRRQQRASLKCTACYKETTLPSYQCDGQGCQVVHRQLLPGPLGLLTRVCDCGQVLPNTVGRAAARLTPVCPTCNVAMAKGSGNRQTIHLPVVGAVAAGKTRFLGAAIVALESDLKAAGGGLEVLTPAGEVVIADLRSRIKARKHTRKTAAEIKPTAIPLRCWHADDEIELQVLDVAGEQCTSWESTGELRYLDTSTAYLFILDPLAIPQLGHEMAAMALTGEVLTAEGDQEASYGSVFDRLRADGIRLQRRTLAVVVTKADMVAQLPSGRDVIALAASSDAIRNWLNDVGADRLVERIGRDFPEVRYFLVDSMGSRPSDDPLSPLGPLQWALHANKSKVHAAHGPAAATSGKAS